MLARRSRRGNRVGAVRHGHRPGWRHRHRGGGLCQGTERALDLWRAETHAKLINAYRARLSEYEAKLAELEGEAPAEIESGPTARNRALMIDEVKRACISLLSEQHFEMFDAINTGATGLPQIDFAEAAVEGAYVRFFEHAFEWENLSWASYPYFWGRKSTWLDKVVIEDDDDDFQALLKAGYIRVQIPIRPGFVDAVDHFRLFGEPWLGGSLPTISDDTLSADCRGTGGKARQAGQ